MNENTQTKGRLDHRASCGQWHTWRTASRWVISWFFRDSWHALSDVLLWSRV